MATDPKNDPNYELVEMYFNFQARPGYNGSIGKIATYDIDDNILDEVTIYQDLRVTAIFGEVVYKTSTDRLPEENYIVWADSALLNPAAVAIGISEFHCQAGSTMIARPKSGVVAAGRFYTGGTMISDNHPILGSFEFDSGEGGSKYKYVLIEE